jgi:hypothetical protein
MMGTHNCKKSMAMVVALVVVMPMLLWHCSRHQDIIGNYHAVDADRQGRMSATLELQANGKGLWSIETDNAPFRWDRRQNKIRLHTPSGGVIEGTIDNRTIHLAIPGMGVIRFERDGQQRG